MCDQHKIFLSHTFDSFTESVQLLLATNLLLFFSFDLRLRTFSSAGKLMTSIDKEEQGDGQLVALSAKLI